MQQQPPAVARGRLFCVRVAVGAGYVVVFVKQCSQEKMGMNCYDWPTEFRQVYEAGQKSYDGGERTPEKLFTTRELEFLRGIGCTAQEI